MCQAEGKTSPEALRTCSMCLSKVKRPIWIEWSEQEGEWKEMRLERWRRKYQIIVLMAFVKI